ncbi:hypothetical protein KM043_016626 [Ampulex compressa]|nr:hypothetical protein KM043_016626 [Ampulex compressa]
MQHEVLPARRIGACFVALPEAEQCRYGQKYKYRRLCKEDFQNVERVGNHVGPHQTSTAVDYMKLWVNSDDTDEESDSEDEDGVLGQTLMQDG